ncbi:MAG: hypothetical protein DMG68_03345 [Acidobacteria bacterium]|jgi:hypothetical protein|nr:MAG: hypothetical protein DMG68_03345 [Acidobacteriota bacterium]
MTCKEMRERMPDLAFGGTSVSGEMEAHVRSCSECAGKLEEIRKTMALLDEWQTPEPSPYFDTRLQARLREEKAKAPAGWLVWIRKPALALVATVLLIVGITMFRRDKVPDIAGVPGTAVGDLQQLDKNQDLYSDFDVLDDLQVEQDQTANP